MTDVATPTAAVAPTSHPTIPPASSSAPSTNGRPRRSLLLFAVVLVLLSRIHPAGSPTSSNVSYQRRLSEHVNRKRMADAEEHRQRGTRSKFAILALAAQTLFILLFFIYVDYDEAARPLAPGRSSTPNDSSLSPADTAQLLLDQMLQHGPMFQETFFFIVAGFGLIYCFVSRYNFSAVGESLLITAISAQWGMLCKGFLYSTALPIKLNVFSLIGGVGVACAVLVTWGILLGKLSPVQLIILVMIEVPVLVGTEWVALTIFKAKDVGGSMLTHEWGAYFGMAVTAALYRPEFEEETNLPYKAEADFRSLTGTLILWVFWPTCIASPLVGPERLRVFINIYSGMMGSCVATFIVTSLLDKDGKFGMVSVEGCGSKMFHVQNATIAGGIAVGTAADMLIGPGGALIAGMVGAIVTIVGIDYLQPALATKLHIHDTAGVHNLHGLVGLIGGITGAIVTAVATEDSYGYGLYTVFPARIPQWNTTDFNYLQESLPHLSPGLGRSGLEQAGFQVATLVMSFLVPMIAGTLTGFILKTPFCDYPTADKLYLDDAYWRLPDPASEADHDSSSLHTISRPVSLKDRAHKNNTVAPSK